MDKSYYSKYEPIFGVWKIGKLLGEGSFGKVFELEREDFGIAYKAALKTITIPASASEVLDARAEGMDDASIRRHFGAAVQELVQEFALLSRFKGNSNVVSYDMVKRYDENGYYIDMTVYDAAGVQTWP